MTSNRKKIEKVKLRINEYYNNKLEIAKRKINVYKKHHWEFWNEAQAIAEKELEIRQEYQEEIEQLLTFINSQRDEGNVLGSKGFSASICLSEVIKMLEEKVKQ